MLVNRKSRFRLRLPSTILVVAALATAPGCAAVHSVFTNPTGQITISRQEFINTYAVVKVLYARMRANWTGDPGRPTPGTSG